LRVVAWAVAAGLAFTATACGGSSSSRPVAPRPHGRERPASPADHLSLRQQVGQLLILSFHGARAPGYVERILRDRTAAGVILAADNVASPNQLRGLTRSLQQAGGGSVLVSTDQEGGAVRIVPFAGPERGQPEQTTPARARAAARTAARDLRGLGVNVNFAPVADVAPAGSAVGGRSFAGGPEAVAARVAAAVHGAQAGATAATIKHFPGFGAASANTDDRPVTIERTAAALRAGDLVPFRAGVAAGVALVMASHALYPALDARHIASQSPVLLGRLLRDELHFSGVAITDSIEARAVIRRSPVDEAAVRSVAAGADLVLMTGPGSYRLVFPRLLREARTSPTFRRRVHEAAGRVLELKRRLGLRRAK
jgi:beta-N-acetylhexosaminidase